MPARKRTSAWPSDTRQPLDEDPSSGDGLGDLEVDLVAPVPVGQGRPRRGDGRDR